MRDTVLERADAGIKKEDLSAFLALVEQRVFELQAEAKPIGLGVYAEKPRCFVKRMRTYWEIWQQETPCAGECRDRDTDNAKRFPFLHPRPPSAANPK